VVSFWDVTSGKQSNEVSLEGFEPSSAYSLKFDSDGNPIAVGSVKSAVVVWELPSGKQSRKISENLPRESRMMALSQGGKTLAIGYGPTGYYESSTGHVVLRDVTRGEQLKNSPLDIERGRVTVLAFSPNGETLAVGYGSYGVHGTGLGGVVLWDVTHGKQLENSPLDLTKGGVDGVAFSPDGKTIAFPYDDGKVAQWSLDGTNRLKALPMVETDGSVVTVAFSRDGKSHLLATGHGRDVTMWKLVDGKKVKGPSLNGFEGNVISVAFNPEGNMVATGNHKGNVALWDVASGNRLKSLPAADRTSIARSLAFSSEGKKLAVVHDGGKLVLWDMVGNRQLAEASIKMGRDRFSVAFSREGTMLVTGYSLATKAKGSGGVVLWKVASDKLSQTADLEVSEGSVHSVAFSANGKRLAAGYQDGNGLDGGVVLWNVATRQRLGSPLAMTNARVVSVAFNPDKPDEEVLAAGFIETRSVSVGGVVLLPGLGEWKHIAKGVANRNLTRAEWQQYFPGEEYRPTFDDLPVPPETDPSVVPPPPPAARDMPKRDPE
jgi:WD40 repeat protein